MLHTSAYQAGRSVTGSSRSPTIPHGFSPQELATFGRSMGASRATIADSLRVCHEAQDLLAAVSERLLRSQHLLASSRDTSRETEQRVRLERAERHT